MDANRIITFLRQLMANNNRAWFQAHKAEYDAVRADFEAGVAQVEEVEDFEVGIIYIWNQTTVW